VAIAIILIFDCWLLFFDAARRRAIAPCVPQKLKIKLLTAIDVENSDDAKPYLEKAVNKAVKLVSGEADG
jgi:hypothetical protein